jgi:DNA-binding NarL/FixJ family response regulator
MLELCGEAAEADTPAGTWARHIVAAVQDIHGEDEDTPAAPVGLLSRRELEVLTLLSDGWINKEIAADLSLSAETVKKHIYNLYRKLGVHNRVTAIAMAKEMGLLPKE